MSWSEIISILNTSLLVISAVLAFQTVSISERKYEQENRPYIFLDSLAWNGSYEDLFSATIKNPGTFPANVVLSVTIQDSEGNEIMTERKEEMVIFPSEKEETISFGYREAIVNLKSRKSDKRVKVLLLENKDAKKLSEYYQSGNKLKLIADLTYSPIFSNANNRTYSFKQEYQIRKVKDFPEVEKIRQSAN